MEEKTDTFQNNILNCTRKFADAATKVINSVLGVEFSPKSAKFIETGVALENKFIVTIFFTGTVYGEYTLAFNEDVARGLMALPNADRDEMSDVFCEILNMIVGESVVELNSLFQKLTMTPPRVQFGSVKYPKIKTGHVSLYCDKGIMDCYLSVDRMQLDIATSYKNALSSLTIAHHELQVAMNQLQHQQTLLVQNEKLAAFGTIAAGVAHEINTPLSIVSMMGEQMRDLVAEPNMNRAEFIKMLNTVEVTVLRISKITKSLWTFASRMQDDAITPFSVKDLMEDTFVICDHRLKAAGIELIRSSAFDHIFIEGRMPQISQLIMNFLFNACEAIQGLPEKWIKIDYLDLENELEIQITDSGAGISEPVRQRMFEPFFTTKKSDKNSGLGMSIAKRIIEDHHGSIRIEEYSKNTCFIITVPKKRKKAA